MRRRWFSILAVPALVAAGLLAFADQASAQRFGGLGLGFGRYGGYGTGLGYGSGLGYGYSPFYSGYGYSPYYGNSMYYGATGNRFSPWYSNYNPGYWNNTAYSGAYNTYYPQSNWGYSWNQPSGAYYNGTMGANTYTFQPGYNYGGMNTSNFNNMQGASTSFYSAGQGFDDRDVPHTAALIDMRVPPHAQVWFSGEQTRQQGMHRQFVTPALDTGKTFFYQIRAKWDENGQTIDRTRKVLVHAGDRTSIDFAPHMTVVSEMTPAQPRQAERIRTGTPSERRFYEEENQGNLNQNQQPPANVNIYNNQNQTPPANNTGTAPANTNTGTKPPATGTNNRPPQP